MSIRDPYVDQFLLIPVQALFGKLTEDKKTHYYEALKKYTDTELKGVAEWLRDQYDGQRFPSIALLHKTRREIVAREERKTSAIDHTRREYPWETRASNIKKRVDEYLKYFEGLQLYAQAQAGGWNAELWQYARSVAEVQSQLIEKSQNVSYSSAIIFGIARSANAEDKQKEREWWLEQRKQAETMMINVSIPSDKIEEWKRNIKTTTPLQTSVLKKENELPGKTEEFNYGPQTLGKLLPDIDASNVF